MYVSSCKSVDISIDVVKYEEGFFQCCQIFYKGVIYSGIPPYDHPIYKTTLLLWPYSFKPTVKIIESFYYLEDPVNGTTSLLRPGFYGPMVVALTGFHCITNVSVSQLKLDRRLS